MPGIEDIVNVQISRQSAKITQAGFGTLLIFGPHVAFPERVRTYGSADAAANDFPVGDPIRLAIDAAFAQSPTVEQVKVGRQQVDSVTVSVDTVLNSTQYDITIGGLSVTPKTISVTSDATAQDTEIAAAFVAAINGDPDVSPLVNATDNLDGTFDIAADVPGTPFTVVPDSKMSLVLGTATGRGALQSLTPAANESGANIGNGLQAVSDEDADWYGLVTVSVQTADVIAAATWVETHKKLYGVASGDQTIINTPASSDTTSIPAQLTASSIARTFTIYSGTPESFPDAAWIGERFPADPGSSTWMFKTLATVPVDNLTDTQVTNCEAKNCNYYIRRGGVAMTANGVVAEPEYIDVIRFVDWLDARISETVFGTLVNSPKVPFTDAGIAALEAGVKARLADGVAVGGLAEDPPPVTTVPQVSSVPVNDRANRQLKQPYQIKFTARLAGAIHKLDITGTVSV